VVLLLSAGSALVAVAQTPAVAHNTWTSGAPMPTALKFPAGTGFSNRELTMPASEMTECPKCGRMVPPTKCVCGYEIGLIRWNQGTLKLAIKQGWRVFKCLPTPECREGVSILVHADRNCTSSYCPHYPTKHRHGAPDVNEIVLVDDKPGGANRA